MSPAPRTTVFDCQGVAVRMVARRPDGKVLVEYLLPKSLQPTETYRTSWPHQLKAPGCTMAHIKSLAVVLPLVRLAVDDGVTIDAPSAANIDRKIIEHHARLPYRDDD